jgi:outer membrane protein assembly factor BamB
MSSVNPPYQLNSNTQTTPSIVVVSELYRVAELSNRSKPASPLSLRWTYVAGFRMNQPPLITSERLLAISTEREIVATPKLMNQELMSFRTDSPISATASKLGDVAYLPTSDASLYALHAISGRILWRFGADGSLTQKPAVTFNDVFVVSTLGNLYRVDRDQGLSVWRDGLGRDLPIQGISSFVSTNDRFVYAMDKRENLIVADRDRGQILGQIDLSGFTVAMRNDQTDRIYLASQDGKIICMHDLALSAPIPLKKKDIESEPAPAVVPAKPKPMPKFPEGQPVEPKKKDDKKNEKKDE